MKKTMFTFLGSVFLIAGLKAQSIQEGVNHLNADRFNSAIGVFQKLLATNPNNIEATYWLGQTYFDMDDNAAARSLYEKALATNGSAPLVLVGLGHADLHDNKTNDARQKFEAAITASRGRKGDDPVVLYAIGRANVDAKAGDFNYAIEKLKYSVDKGEKTAESLVQLGNAYRKAKPGEGGGDAYQSYNKALAVDPSYVVAYIRLAKLFESQKNWDLVLNYLNKAVEKDPTFAPAYYELFYYYFFRMKYPEAEAQLQKYIANTDKDIQNEFLYAQLCWARKDFDCAITKGESVMTAMGMKAKPKVMKLLADAYFEKGDYVNAKKYSDMYFTREKPGDIIALDYQLLAKILDKTGGTPDEVANTYLRGAQIDTVLTSKVDFLKKGAEVFKAKGDSVSRLKEGDLRLEILKLKPNFNQRELFDAGFAFYQGKALERSDSLFEIYSQKWPEETYGWSMRYESTRLMDSAMERGTAIPYALKYLEVLEKDTAKNKKQILSVYNYIVVHYANYAKDKDKAIETLKKMQIYDPENPDIKNNLQILEKSKTSTSGTTPKGNAPPKKPAVKTTTKTTTKAPVKKTG